MRGGAVVWLLVLCGLAYNIPAAQVTGAPLKATKKNAYATMVYMGTPRDYEFYTAARVLLQSLARFEVDADLVVIASKAVPQKWRRTL